MHPAITQMSDECVAHILRERENSVIVGLGASHSEAAVLPIDIAWGQIGDFLHPESKPKTQQQESPIASMAPLLSAAGGKKRMNLLAAEIFRQTGLAVAGDFWQGGVPAPRNSLGPCKVPQDTAQNHQPGSLRVTTRQPCELRLQKIHNGSKTKLAPVDTLVWKLKSEEPTNHVAMKLSR